MKNSLIILSVILLFSCKKQGDKNVTPTDANSYTHFTSQQIWDSIGFKYEKKYMLYLPTFIKSSDTLIFNSNGSITEIVGQDTVIFSAHYFTTDTAVHNATDPVGKYNRTLSFSYYPPIDTIYHNAPHNHVFSFIVQLLKDTTQFTYTGYIPGIPDSLGNVWGCSAFNLKPQP